MLVADQADARAVADAFGTLPPVAFEDRRHRTLWSIARAVHAAGDDVDVVTVLDAAKRGGMTNTIGGAEYLSTLLDVVPSAIGLRSYVRRLREDLRGRKVATAVREFADEVLERWDADRAAEHVAEIDRILTDDIDPLDAVLKDDWPDSLADIPRRNWLVPGWMPRGRVTLLTGEGASGKSMLTLQLAVAAAGRVDDLSGRWRRWLPLGDSFESEIRPDVSPVVHADGAEQGSVLLATWEDEYEEIAKRRLRIGAPWPIEPGMLKHLSLRKAGALWGPKTGVHVATKGEVTPTGESFAEALERIEPRPSLVVVDPVAAAFGSDENARNLVRQFISKLDDWADANECAILLVSHPSKQALISGSTDWRNGPRAVIAFEEGPTPDAFVPKADGSASTKRAHGTRLRLEKANYGRAGATAWVRWRREDVPTDDDWEKRISTLRIEECSAFESATALADSRGEPTPVQAA